MNGSFQFAWIYRIALAAGLAMAGRWVTMHAMHGDAGPSSGELSRGNFAESAANLLPPALPAAPAKAGRPERPAKLEPEAAGEGASTGTVAFVRPAPVKASAQARIADGKYIDVNLATQILSLFEDGQLVDTYIISSGKSGMETPKGTHTVVNKSCRAWSRKYGVFLPYWMAITPGGSFGIHEVPEWPDGGKEGAGELGLPVSHGCVRLGNGAAERVYDWADIGTPVVVY